MFYVYVYVFYVLRTKLAEIQMKKEEVESSVITLWLSIALLFFVLYSVAQYDIVKIKFSLSN